MTPLPTSMTDTPAPALLVAPVAGPWTLLVALGLILVAIMTARTSPVADLASQAVPSTDTFRRQMIFAGMIYGYYSGIVWWSSFVHQKWFRWTLVTVIGLVLSGWMAYQHERPWARYVVQFGGFAVVQCVVFWIARVPRWVWWRSTVEPSPSHRDERKSPQFTSVDLLAATTAVAVLIAAGHTYQLGSSTDLLDEAGILASTSSEATAVLRTFWLGIAAVWIWLPLMSLWIAKLGCCRSLAQGLVAMTSALATAGFGTLGMTYLQANWSRSSVLWDDLMLGDYGMFVVLYAYLFGGQVLAGRWDSLVKRVSQPSVTAAGDHDSGVGT